MRGFGFAIQIVRPFLQYFELLDRGIGFLTRNDAWCRPLLIGTAFLGWLQNQGARNTRHCVMFRGMSGSEYSLKYHAPFEMYRALDMPCFNPVLYFKKQEIVEVVTRRYGLPLNPVYEHLDRTYCICCYTGQKRSLVYGRQRFPEICERYYASIRSMLFDSGLVQKSHRNSPYGSLEEKVYRHGFVNWRRRGAQDSVGAVKHRLPHGVLAYNVRDEAWINTKHLRPVDGRWLRRGREIRFWDVSERAADVVVKRMMNCLDCGFCVMECFPCKAFQQDTKTLVVEGCSQCGACLSLKYCMGWRHRFWRRIIREAG